MERVHAFYYLFLCLPGTTIATWDFSDSWLLITYKFQVRKSMCRIKQVLTERAIEDPDPRRTSEMKRMINALWWPPAFCVSSQNTTGNVGGLQYGLIFLGVGLQLLVIHRVSLVRSKLTNCNLFVNLQITYFLSLMLVLLVVLSTEHMINTGCTWWLCRTSICILFGLAYNVWAS